MHKSVDSRANLSIKLLLSRSSVSSKGCPSSDVACSDRDVVDSPWALTFGSKSQEAFVESVPVRSGSSCCCGCSPIPRRLYLVRDAGGVLLTLLLLGDKGGVLLPFFGDAGGVLPILAMRGSISSAGLILGDTGGVLPILALRRGETGGVLPILALRGSISCAWLCLGETLPIQALRRGETGGVLPILPLRTSIRCISGILGHTALFLGDTGGVIPALRGAVGGIDGIGGIDLFLGDIGGVLPIQVLRELICGGHRVQ